MASPQPTVPDVFISYAREDRDVAHQIAEALKREGLEVWWDWDLVGGANYRTKIRQVIRSARKSVVIWSSASVESAFVIDEASEAKKLGKLVPILIEECEVPLGFGDLHTITLPRRSLDLTDLLAAIHDRTPPVRTAPRRPPSRRKALVAGLGALGLGTVGAGYALMTPRGREPVAARTNRIALVVGNGAYRDLPKLDNTTRDADLIAAQLDSRGFQVVKTIDADGAAMLRAFTDFDSTLAIVGGVGVFFYAGSAVYIDGEDIMLPVDAALDKTGTKLLGGVNLTRLQREVSARTTRPIENHGVAVIYSASKGELAADGPAGGNSPFTTAFARAMEADDAELADVFRRVRSEFVSAAGPKSFKQTPYLEDNRSKSFRFGRPDQDPAGGALKILVLDSCRDNPFKIDVATR